MRAEAERYDLAAWKSYTHVGRPWRLDDDTGEAFLALVEEIGPPIVCVHKGLGGDPATSGPAAAAHPDITLRRLPLGLRGRRDRGRLRAGRRRTAASTGCSSPCGRPASGRAATSTPSSAPPGGTSWATPTRPPTCSGKLIAALGPGNVLWGTDSIWYGSPQDQIDAFRTFEITAEAQERFGYAPLTAEVKAGILAGNAARLYGVDPAARAVRVIGRGPRGPPRRPAVPRRPPRPARPRARPAASSPPTTPGSERSERLLRRRSATSSMGSRAGGRWRRRRGDPPALRRSPR